MEWLTLLLLTASIALVFLAVFLLFRRVQRVRVVIPGAVATAIAYLNRLGWIQGVTWFFNELPILMKVVAVLWLLLTPVFLWRAFRLNPIGAGFIYGLLGVVGIGFVLWRDKARQYWRHDLLPEQQVNWWRDFWRYAGLSLGILATVFLLFDRGLLWITMHLGLAYLPALIYVHLEFKAIPKRHVGLKKTGVGDNQQREVCSVGLWRLGPGVTLDLFSTEMQRLNLGPVELDASATAASAEKKTPWEAQLPAAPVVFPQLILLYRVPKKGELPLKAENGQIVEDATAAEQEALFCADANLTDVLDQDKLADELAPEIIRTLKSLMAGHGLLHLAQYDKQLLHQTLVTLYEIPDSKLRRSGLQKVELIADFPTTIHDAVNARRQSLEAQFPQLLESEQRIREDERLIRAEANADTRRLRTVTRELKLGDDAGRLKEAVARTSIDRIMRPTGGGSRSKRGRQSKQPRSR